MWEAEGYKARTLMLCRLQGCGQAFAELKDAEAHIAAHGPEAYFSIEPHLIATAKPKPVEPVKEDEGAMV
jgi:hypothetical protein